MDNLDFNNLEFDCFNQTIPEYTEEDARIERLLTLDCCCTCKHFKYMFASAGICLLNKISNDKIVNFVDYMDNKCKKWDVCNEEKDFFESII